MVTPRASHKGYVRPVGLASLGGDSYFAEPYRVRSPHRVHVGSGVTVEARSVLSVVDVLDGERYGGVLRIGDGCAIESDFYVHCAGEVTLGDDVRIGPRVFLGDSVPDASRTDSSAIGLRVDAPRPVRIGDGAVIGAGTVILPGVAIGAGACVAPGSAVTRDVPSGAVVAGFPTRAVRRGRPAGGEG